jgi:hypothetical protein
MISFTNSDKRLTDPAKPVNKRKVCRGPMYGAFPGPAAPTSYSRALLESQDVIQARIMRILRQTLHFKRSSTRHWRCAVIGIGRCRVVDRNESGVVWRGNGGNATGEDDCSGELERGLMGVDSAVGMTTGSLLS